MPEEIAILILTGLLGGFTLTGLKMFLGYREKRFSRSGEDIRHLEETVTGLRDEVYLLRNDITDLQERLEFTERVLSQNREPPGLPKS